jgi:hypothetical protein
MQVAGDLISLYDKSKYEWFLGAQICQVNIPFSIEKCIFTSFSATFIPSDLRTPTKSSLYFAISSTTALSENALYILLTFHIPNLVSIFFCLGLLSKDTVQVRGFLRIFVTSFFFYGEELLAPRPTLKLEDYPLSAVRDCLFNIFVAALQNWRGLHHPHLYGCETWSLTIWEEHKLRVFENRVLRRIFHPIRDAKTGGWRKLHDKELHNVNSSPSIIRVIRLRSIKCIRNVACMGKMRDTKLWSENVKGRDRLEDFGVGERTLLRLKGWNVRL